MGVDLFNLPVKVIYRYNIFNSSLQGRVADIGPLVAIYLLDFKRLITNWPLQNKNHRSVVLHNDLEGKKFAKNLVNGPIKKPVV